VTLSNYERNWLFFARYGYPKLFRYGYPKITIKKYKELLENEG